jgi:D-glycero-D-manno-heptose 1,7-bisphosphate phosphatase
VSGVDLKRAVFLDRDGVINVDHGYVSSWDQFEFLPGVPAALWQLQSAGYDLVVVSNQSGIGRGLYTEHDLAVLNRRIHRCLLDDHGVEIARFYHCPHHPTEALLKWRQQCHCRKPAPGMIEQACADLHIDPSSSLMVGDKASDMEAGQAAGVGWLFRVAPEASAKSVSSGVNRNEGLAVVEGLPDVARIVSKSLAQV